MKHLFASLLTVVCFATYAQFPSLPYNPDENGDGLIGVVDLQGLLANYGNEFASAVVSEDGENAITFMGEMAYPLCATACEGLPGMWQLPSIDQLGLIWEEVNAASTLTWLIKDLNGGDVLSTSGQGIWGMRVYNSNGYMYGSAQVNQSARCYCAAKQLPRVEYDQCVSVGTYGNLTEILPGLETQLNECVNSKLVEGWMLNGATSKLTADPVVVLSQGLWRWAE